MATRAASFTGKPVETEGLSVATQQPLMADLSPEKVRTMLGKDASDMRVAIQGFGNAGFNFACTAHKAGYKIIAVSDSRGGIRAKNGVFIEPNVVMEK